MGSSTDALSARQLAAALLLALAGIAACRAHERAPAPAPSASPSAAPAPPPVPKAAARPACPPVSAAKVARFECNAKVVKAPVPPIVDPHDTMAPFYAKLAALARGTRRERVRIAVFGDSNLTSDFLTGHLRRALQARFGDAGHGWVSFSRPWLGYVHEDVDCRGYWSMFHLYAPTTHLVRDRQYGFANMAAESDQVGAAAWARTVKGKKATVGQSVGSFELYFLKQPRGGSFDVLLDHERVRTVSTRADAFEAGFEVVKTEDGPHEIKAEVRGDGRVRFFGVSLDRDVPGVQVDSLGAGSLNYERLHWVADATRKAQLERRGYDLVVVWLGANVMFVPPNEGYAKEFVAQLRAALPGAPIVLLTPGDTVVGTSTHSSKRIVAVAEQIRKVADDEGTAFWDFREAMGGDGSVVPFTKRGLVGKDHIHFGPEGSALMGNRLLCAMFDDLGAHLEARPDLGCPAPAAEPGARLGVRSTP